jgi:hypothetical protein
MVKTMRITSVLSVLFVAVFLAFPAILVLGSNKQSGNMLSSESIVEKFKKAKDARANVGKEEEMPLVKEAQKFALYLNPPAPKPAARPAGRGVKPKITTAKFKLVGTSIYSSDPSMSLALIDEPGKGLRWVRQSSKIERFVVEQIKNGVMVVSDGPTKIELKAEREPKKSLLRNPLVKPEGTSETIVSSDTAGQSGQGLPDEIKQISNEEQAAMEQPTQEEQNQDVSSETEGGGSENMTSEEIKTFAELEAVSQVNEEEANTLSGLGKELKNEEALAAERAAKARDIGLKRMQQIRSSRIKIPANQNK